MYTYKGLKIKCIFVTFVTNPIVHPPEKSRPLRQTSWALAGSAYGSVNCPAAVDRPPNAVRAALHTGRMD